jgi:hypothetical protein
LKQPLPQRVYRGRKIRLEVVELIHGYRAQRGRNTSQYQEEKQIHEHGGQGTVQPGSAREQPHHGVQQIGQQCRDHQGIQQRARRNRKPDRCQQDDSDHQDTCGG